MQTTIFVSILIITLAISTLAGADAPLLTIESVEGTKGILTITYTVVDPSGVEFVTAGWQFSTDGGTTWLDIDAVAISNNAPKPSGSSFITWDTVLSPGSGGAQTTLRTSIAVASPSGCP